MSLETQVADLVTATNSLTGTVNTKIADIDSAKNTAVATIATRITEFNSTDVPALEATVDGFVAGHDDKVLSHMHYFNVDLTSNTGTKTDYTGTVFTPDKDTYYPVYIPISAQYSHKHILFRYYGSEIGGDASGDANTNGRQGIYAEFDISGGSWGGNIMRVNKTFSQQTYYQALAGAGFASHGYGVVYFLRGGLKYKFYLSSANYNPRVYGQSTKYYNHSLDQYDETFGPITNPSTEMSADQRIGTGVEGSQSGSTLSTRIMGYCSTVGGHAGA